MKTKGAIPSVDLFAGPGGLGEGFCAPPNSASPPRFVTRLSIEKDALAHRTLELRSFFRKFPSGYAPSSYYDYLRGSISRATLFARHPDEALAAGGEAVCAELGGAVPGHDALRKRIGVALSDNENWVLLGGPPCQAYSLVGRSRNKGKKEYDAEKDHKQTLYIEYLQVIADHWPAVFVMENVKGMLSASLGGRRVFDRILEDLHDPAKAILREKRVIQSGKRRQTYRIHSLVSESMFEESDPRQFIVKCEEYGIPQARHRVILLGVREDIGDQRPELLLKAKTVTLREVLEGMPKIRSGLSKGLDSPGRWREVLDAAPDRRWFGSVRSHAGEQVAEEIVKALSAISTSSLDRGGEFVAATPAIGFRKDWYLDRRLDGYANHSTRGHIDKDLHRYLFAACFAKVKGYAPDLSQFPADLLPAHNNLKNSEKSEYFADRFRVQRWDQPSTTVVSHISKDGHYYIHPDPSQCRSLTVREAARLQTFPDNYFFEGPRTAQYLQVGNAVPPLLGQQIAAIVARLLDRAGVT